eukprot:4636101-Pleurochrysis_carterae.AAC.1
MPASRGKAKASSLRAAKFLPASPGRYCMKASQPGSPLTANDSRKVAAGLFTPPLLKRTSTTPPTGP